jgi:hypothetical protein
VPDPDLTTVTLADAHLLGGPEFVAQVREDATAVADELACACPKLRPGPQTCCFAGCRRPG